jgi:hypothetical protein
MRGGTLSSPAMPVAPREDTLIVHQQRSRFSTRWAAAAGLVLHSLVVLWIWKTWETGLRGVVLFWLDLPASLVYLGDTGSALLGWSLLVGGVQWAVWGWLLSWLLARIFAQAERESRPNRS